ncbi:MAG: bifunctional adenosylcobinamide kinase/adenosylcobinamide-phosphate guanylyltransferase [Alphaproteobacteria bacterium]|nr:bifunctional adenosylcobinamide kinase/adenosylcobinamide-phosphate guanylyltransferase [Alphaproteobacteria bacterium]
MRRSDSILVLGGARSGKTARAMHHASGLAERVYLATAEGRDDEMRARIAEHRAARDASWETIEVPLDLPGAITAHAGAGRAVVVDCLTLWLSNLMERGAPLDAATTTLIGAVTRAPGRVILISNEVGLGLVPETPLGRAFRDAQGRLNQAVAAAVERVEFMAAGLPLTLKGKG